MYLPIYTVPSSTKLLTILSKLSTANKKCPSWNSTHSWPLSCSSILASMSQSHLSRSTCYLPSTILLPIEFKKGQRRAWPSILSRKAMTLPKRWKESDLTLCCLLWNLYSWRGLWRCTELWKISNLMSPLIMPNYPSCCYRKDVNLSKAINFTCRPMLRTLANVSSKN